MSHLHRCDVKHGASESESNTEERSDEGGEGKATGERPSSVKYTAGEHLGLTGEEQAWG